MKKKLLLPCLLLVMALLMTAGLSFSISAEEITMTDLAAETKTAQEGDTVTISSVAEWEAFAAYVNAGKVTSGITFKQTADIAFAYDSDSYVTNLTFAGTSTAPFAGTYDGDGHALKDLLFSAIDEEGEPVSYSYMAPFAYVANATVKNVAVEKIHLFDYEGFAPIGGVIGEAKNANIINCHTGDSIFSVSDDAISHIGGIVSKAVDCTIDSCTNKIQINANCYAGGIADSLENTTVRNCTNYTAINYEEHAKGGSTKGQFFGGIASIATGTSCIENCYSASRISGVQYVGGITGSLDTDATMRNCFVDGLVEATNNAGSNTIVGLLTGSNAGSISYCYARDSRQLQQEVQDMDYDVLAATPFVGFADSASDAKTEHCYLFRKNTVDTKVSYVLGTVPNDPTNEEVLHNSYVGNDHEGNNCACNANGGKVTHAFYRFAPLANDATLTVGTTQGITSLADALNAWASQFGATGVTYVDWSISATGSIVNCAHTNTRYSKEASCKEAVVADLVCADCGKVLEAGVTLDQKAHTWPEGLKACEDSKCKVCDTARSAESDPTFQTHTPNHKQATCTEDKVCTVCEKVLEAKKNHLALPASCEADRYCLTCGGLVYAQLPHAWEKATCGKGAYCKICFAEDEENGPTGLHQWNISAATCETRKYCTLCNKQEQAALGHLPGDEADCGHAQKCDRCHKILVSASGEHEFDTSSIVVVKEPDGNGWGEYKITCTHCGLSVTKNFIRQPSVSASSDATGSITGGTAILPTDITLKIMQKKVADVANAQPAEGYALLQVVDISLVDGANATYTMNGKVTVRLKLNNSASQLGLDMLKLYHVADDGTTTELQILSCEDGYITFETDHFSTYAVAAAKEKAAETLGTADDDTSKDGGLPTGAIIGIIVGAVVLVAAAAVVVVFLLGNKKKGAKTEQKDDSEE